MSDNFDLIIVGTGSGNAIPDYLADWKIALVEKGVFGGTCLNRGCIPSKMFVLPADLAYDAHHSSRLGIHTNFEGVDWPAIRDRVFGRIDPIAAGGEHYRSTGSPNVELIKATATFVGPNSMDVDGRIINAPKILLATGASPTIPPIAGLANVDFHTSDTVMRLEHLPGRLGIIGGGFIAAELGHVFSAFGSEVHVFTRSGVMLHDNDADIVKRFNEAFSQRVEIHQGGSPTSVSQAGQAIEINHPNGDIEVDVLLVAAGRTPNVDTLNPRAAGLEVRDGIFVVDNTMATNVPGIWAIGDAANHFQLKHLANAEAKVAFHNIGNSDSGNADYAPRTQNYGAVPAAVFTHPQIASVGITESQAVASGISYCVGKRDYAGTAYGWALEDEVGLAKVIIDSETELVVGAHIIGVQAATLIQPIVQAMELGQTARDIAERVFYIHPALTEVVENALLEALAQT